MRKPIVVAATAALGLGILPAMSAGDPPKDFAVGGGESTVAQFGISAHSGPLGQDPKGHVSSKSTTGSGIQRNGKVTCLNVSGNRAVIGVRIDKAKPASQEQFEGQSYFLVVEDNGPPKGGDSDDEIGSTAPDPAPKTVCPPPSTFTFNLVPFRGNININDA